MPSPIGHALGGVAAAWSAERIPVGEPAGPISTKLTLVCAVLAAAPDLDLLVPGLHRTVTHSVGAIIFTTIITAGVTGRVTRKSGWRTGPERKFGNVLRIAAICGAAYASHILLDWLATDSNPPSGIQALWPFSHQWFIASWTIFPMTERTNALSWRAFVINARALGVEVLILGPLVLALGWARSRRT
jgi:membrane-bound metal-dependent hydrolase YbcI (DUF457 family)